jgi:hypothetical protein
MKSWTTYNPNILFQDNFNYMIGIEELSTGLNPKYKIEYLNSFSSKDISSVYVLANRLIKEKEMENYLETLFLITKSFPTLGGFIVSDLGIFIALKEMLKPVNVVVDSPINNLNEADLELFKKAEAIVTRESIYNTNKSKFPNLIVETGQKVIFRTRRPILDTYENKYNITLDRIGSTFEEQSKENLFYFQDEHEFRIYKKITTTAPHTFYLQSNVGDNND